MAHKAHPNMKLRCLMQREGSLFVAHCIDFGLACQADSPEQAKEKMHAMIVDYLDSVMDIVREGDLRSAKQLLSRKSSWDIRARYFIATATQRCRTGFELLGRPWRELVQSPLTA